MLSLSGDFALGVVVRVSEVRQADRHIVPIEQQIRGSFDCIHFMTEPIVPRIFNSASGIQYGFSFIPRLRLFIWAI